MNRDFCIEIIGNNNLAYAPGQRIQGILHVGSSPGATVNYDGVHLRFIGKCIVRLSDGSLLTESGLQSHFSPTCNPSDFMDSDSAEEVYADETLYFLRGDDQASASTFASQGYVQLPFSLAIPNDIPSTFSRLDACIAYKLLAYIPKPDGVSRSTSLSVTINSPLDLRQDQRLQYPAQQVKDVLPPRFLSSKSAKTTLTCLLSKKGYIPGETIPFTISFENPTKRKIVSASIKLFQIITCRLNAKRYITDKKLLASESLPLSADAASHFNSGVHVSPSLLIIPQTQPTNLGGICSLIDVEYNVKVKICLSGFRAPSIKCTIPITIGTIAVESTHSLNTNRQTMLSPSIPLPLSLSSGVPISAFSLPPPRTPDEFAPSAPSANMVFE